MWVLWERVVWITRFSRLKEPRPRPTYWVFCSTCFSHVTRSNPSTRCSVSTRSIASTSVASSVISYGQNIRTRLPTGGYASPIAGASACLSLPTPPYSASSATTKAEGGGDELEDLTGIYYRDGRSGTAAAQRISGHGKSDSASPDQGACSTQRRRTHHAGGHWPQVGQASPGGSGHHR